ncbi:hypothetical protein [Thalassococcus sp. S3]|uniref:hypothetical protein n=1 Tax=Thalassococcus sp. S3 TaxID=2017482 RepID=UPI001023FE0F|nr:hypothetical protein [Thalassococcus sp. S3]QBF32647.1 hypothetical protein CFI11_15690 [Thalassococcus sp. S3]
MAQTHCPEDLSTAIKQLGFENMAELAGWESMPVMKARMARRGHAVTIDEAQIKCLLCGSKRAALRRYRLMRHAVAVQDPMNPGLRQTPSALSASIPAAVDDPAPPLARSVAPR